MLLFYFILGNAINANVSSEEYIQFLLGHAVQMFGNIPDLRPGNKC